MTVVQRISTKNQICIPQSLIYWNLIQQCDELDDEHLQHNIDQINK
jgi:hypothetical protein